ncbi:MULTISPECIES: glycoside hydrolase family 28 protein [unclassified Arenibacter]|uniref:glycoside hydrolase family 28 protein n=1 Tax=unclassified Arenibacter TaxID=2615047 RepID=UPI000E352E96|nr:MULTISPECIES: glycosyl hydrolase family 28 protein [unclassified Arenibacter]MCM4164579.1 glycoside hydrolase [Arenibacter sp. A80]RFT55663.1 glycoside hydrolase family 28 protein [Arenibacter sp. P308M17]
MYNTILTKSITGFLILAVSTGIMAQEYTITDYGAKNDGKTLASAAIQSAIDAAHKSGGGRVIVPKGVFLTGSIVLKTGIELHLKKEAVLLGSTDPYDYKGINRWKALVLADGQSHIAITGEGTIDGRGQELAIQVDSLFHIGKLDSTHYNIRRKRPSEVLRPQLIEMVNSNHIDISGITLKNAACWVQTYDRCTDLVIDRIQVDSDAYWNNDGMDISDCKNVRITNSYVNAADDGICLKSHTKGFFNDNIYIANCTIRSSASAIKFGTASVGGFRNIRIENITIFDTFRSALAFEAVDGGTIENVVVNNVSASTTGNALFIKLGHRNVDGEIGAIKNITVKNLNVHVPFAKPDLKYNIRGPESPFFHNIFPASITGLPGHDVENITLENVSISYPGRGNKGYAHMPTWRLNSVPEQATSYPEFSMFGELPSWGLYVRHVSGLEMKNVRLGAREHDYRPAYVFDDVKGLKIEGGSITSLSTHGQLIVKDVMGMKVNHLFVDGIELQKVISYGTNSEILGVEILK